MTSGRDRRRRSRPGLSGRARHAGLLLAVPFLALAWCSRAEAQERAAAPERPKSGADEREPESGILHGFFLETEPELDTGKFGTKTRSTFLYVPETLGYEEGAWTGSLTVPWVLARSQGNVTFVGGRAVRTSNSGLHKTRTDAGIGDILLDGGYTLWKQDKEASLPSLSLDAEVKFPTADDERGLGTGAYDETFRATSDVTFFRRVKATAGVGYGIIGQPEDFSKPKFHDLIYWSGGVGYAFDRNNELWIKTDGSTHLIAHAPPYSLLFLEFDHWFKNESKLLVELGVGVTKSTPGLVLSAGYVYYF